MKCEYEMTTVFVLVGIVKFEGKTILGVYDTEEKAYSAYYDYIRAHYNKGFTHSPFDDYDAIPIVVNEKADDYL
jgi:acetylornithine/succinyldiaminopimelate/putrescine aminotransferase